MTGAVEHDAFEPRAQQLEQRRRHRGRLRDARGRARATRRPRSRGAARAGPRVCPRRADRRRPSRPACAARTAPALPSSPRLRRRARGRRAARARAGRGAVVDAARAVVPGRRLGAEAAHERPVRQRGELAQRRHAEQPQPLAARPADRSAADRAESGARNAAGVAVGRSTPSPSRGAACATNRFGPMPMRTRQIDVPRRRSARRRASQPADVPPAMPVHLEERAAQAVVLDDRRGGVERVEHLAHTRTSAAGSSKAVRASCGDRLRLHQRHPAAARPAPPPSACSRPPGRARPGRPGSAARRGRPPACVSRATASRNAGIQTQTTGIATALQRLRETFGVRGALKGHAARARPRIRVPTYGPLARGVGTAIGAPASPRVPTRRAKR